jgi:membrane-associated phospholipid phosphatase
MARGLFLEENGSFARDAVDTGIVTWLAPLALSLAAATSPAAATTSELADFPPTPFEEIAAARLESPATDAQEAGADHPEDSKVPPAGPPPPHTGLKATLKAIPGDFAAFPSKSTALILAVGGAAALFAHPDDYSVNARLKDSQGFFVLGKTIGQAYVIVGASLGTYIVGRATDNRRLSHLGMDLIRASVLVGTLTYAIKVTVRRDRPTGECCSFPSGHASITFASAAVLWRHLGWKAMIPTYTVATYVSLSRLADNRHFLSDVIFGSALGMASGRTVVRHGRDYWSLQPMIVPHGVGLALVMSGS